MQRLFAASVTVTERHDHAPRLGNGLPASAPLRPSSVIKPAALAPTRGWGWPADRRKSGLVMEAVILPPDLPCRESSPRLPHRRPNPPVDATRRVW